MVLAVYLPVLATVDGVGLRVAHESVINGGSGPFTASHNNDGDNNNNGGSYCIASCLCHN